jgi:dienelactone hydrolase
MKPLLTWGSIFLLPHWLLAEVLTPAGSGPFPVESTNVEIAAEFSALHPSEIDLLLIGSWEEKKGPRFWNQILKHPDDAWVVELNVPDDENLYQSAAGETLPLVIYIAYPTVLDNDREGYSFPRPGIGADFQHMLRPGDKPLFSDSKKQFPLVIASHGVNAHSLFDVMHAQFLASHGYMVAVISHGDGRLPVSGQDRGLAFLRPLQASRVLDAILGDPVFGPRVDPGKIGIRGHSFGGFTVYAAMGARLDSEPLSVVDERIKVGVAASPWTGGTYPNGEYYPFGAEFEELRRIHQPILTFYGTLDQVTEARFILPAVQNLPGTTYLIELVNQPHAYAHGGWGDVQQWELLFMNAYLKEDPQALEILQTASSFAGGVEDRRHFTVPSP